MALMVARPMALVVAHARAGADGDRMRSCASSCACSACASARSSRSSSPHEELRGTVDLLHREGSVEKLDRDMMGGLLDLRDLAVSDVMVHRTEMIDHQRRRSAGGDRQRRAERRATPACRCGATSRRTSSASCTPRICCARLQNAERRRSPGRHPGDRAAAVVRARHPPAVGAAQGVPPAQDATSRWWSTNTARSKAW